MLCSGSLPFLQLFYFCGSTVLQCFDAEKAQSLLHNFGLDIDECRAGDYSCPPRAHCDNTMGSYSCRCPDGLTFHKEENTCQGNFKIK